MRNYRVNIFIILSSILFIGFLSLLFILETIEVNNIKEKTLEDFFTLKNSLLIKDNSLFPSKMKEYFKNSSELSAFRIIDDSDQTIYYYSKSGFQSNVEKLDFFKDLNSIYKVIYNHKIKPSNNFYSIEAAFIVLTHKDIYFIFVKISLIIAVYLTSIILLLIYSNYNKIVSTNSIIQIDKSNVNNSKELDNKITDELKKAASFDHDIVLTLIGSKNNMIKENKPEFLNMLKKHFPFHDLIFKYDDNTFGIILPNLDLEKGIQQIEKFDQTFINNRSTSLNFPIMFGLSSRNGRLISGNVILKEAKAALNKALIDKDFPIIGFRPNPERYREYLTKLKSK